jgi:hypothetical protein
MGEGSGWWKVLGVAGFVGVAATGAVVARRERERRQYAPEEIRGRLQERYAVLQAEEREAATEAWRNRRTT